MWEDLSDFFFRGFQSPRIPHAFSHSTVRFRQRLSHSTVLVDKDEENKSIGPLTGHAAFFCTTVMLSQALKVTVTVTVTLLLHTQRSPEFLAWSWLIR